MVVCTVTDYLSAFIGGLFIGLSATLNLLFLGRITGLSGMFNSIVKFDWPAGFYWKYAFVTGMITVAVPMRFLAGDDGTYSFGDWDIVLFDTNWVASADLHWTGWIIGGFLVGIGTKMGNGCTSGHGICGLARLSIWSWFAVTVFMTTGCVVATVRYYTEVLDQRDYWGSEFDDSWEIASGCLALTMFLCFVGCAIFRAIAGKNIIEKIEMVLCWIFGLLFGFGLVIGGMTRRTKIRDFLTVYSGWDPSLGFVMAGGLTINFITFPLLIWKKKKPIFGDKMQVPTN